jgi:D-glycero-beta-D-manno-heptose-7-phosphate kinase
MTKEEIIQFIKGFSSTKILVVGDIMVDEYIWGGVERISPEAPVPVVTVDYETTILGGAANVVNNLYTLGARAHICGVTGDDEIARVVTKLLLRQNIETDGVIVDFNRRTTLKTRVIAQNQQVVRVDREDTKPISRDIVEKLVEFLHYKIPQVDGVIISDYGKGVVTGELIQEVVRLSREHSKICTVDPKVSHFDLYAGITVITPNHVEAGMALGNRQLRTIEEVHQAALDLRDRVGCEAVLITFGAKGMCLLDRQGDFLHIDTVAKKVFDVTGAGDTVISTLTLALAAGASMRLAAYLANAAAGVVVREFGTATVSQEQLADTIAYEISPPGWE